MTGCLGRAFFSANKWNGASTFVAGFVDRDALISLIHLDDVGGGETSPPRVKLTQEGRGVTRFSAAVAGENQHSKRRRLGSGCGGLGQGNRRQQLRQRNRPKDGGGSNRGFHGPTLAARQNKAIAYERECAARFPECLR